METTTRTHRSRFTPERKKNHLSATENRINGVLEPFTRYARLHTKDVVNLYAAINDIKDGGAAIDALTDFYHERPNKDPSKQILLRPDEINRNGSDTIHELGAGAYLEYFDHLPMEWARRCLIGKSRYSPHDRHLVILIASIEAEIARTPGLRFISHLEILTYEKCTEAARGARRPVSFPAGKSYLEPDALFGVHDERTDTYKFYAVELDRSSESLPTIDGKLSAYTEVISRNIYASHMGLPNLRVLWWTPSIEREQHIIERIPALPDVHLFQQMEKYNITKNPPPPYPHLFGSEWRTANGPVYLRGGDAHGHRTHQAVDRAA